MGKINLDKLDLQILYLLDHDGRQSFSEISKKLKQGRDRVEYRIKRLIEAEIIQGFETILNQYCFGQSIYKNYVRVSGNSKKRQSFIESIRKNKKIFWFVECGGNWDFIFSIPAYNVSEFYEEQRKILKPYTDILTKVSVYPVVNFWIYRQKYLTNDQGTHHFLIGGTLKEDYTLDNLDIAIIKAISRNARATLQELSNTTKTSPSVIAYRISNLEKRKIILGYKARINLAAIGYTNFKAQLYFHSFSSNLENKFRIFCSKHPRIISYIQQIGECRNELEIHAQDYNEYQNVIDELRNSFPNLIDSVSSIMMRNESLNWAAFCS